jgi:hypothetical protein
MQNAMSWKREGKHDREGFIAIMKSKVVKSVDI